MSQNKIFLFSFLLILSLGLYASCSRSGKEQIEPDDFQIVETTIADIHTAIREGKITCRKLTEIYLERISEYDGSTELNAIILTNPEALKRASELDAEFQSSGKLRPMHGIPVIVKDNYETKGLQTTAGSEALKGFLPPDDAYQVKKLKEAGAVILAKSNMAEWAFSPYMTISSIAGVTRNPYNTDYTPAGSSGGTAAAVAANLGAVGLGTDTGNSIRGPSAHCCLVGIRSTMGLTSRDGIIPLYSRNDIGGPMARSVEDAVRILEVISGYDPEDPITKHSQNRIPANFTQFLDLSGLKGARIGVFRLYTQRPKADPKVKELFEQAVSDIKAQGAEIVDPFEIPDFGRLTKNLWCDMFRHDLNLYLAGLGEKAPHKNLIEIFNTGLFSPTIRQRLERALEIPPRETPECRDVYTEPRNIAFRTAVLAVMEEKQIDAFIYPTWNNPPIRLGDNRSVAGDNSQLIPPHTGLPAFNIPMGFSYKNLPAGLQIVGKLFGEPELIRIAYAYEQATKHRRPPDKFN